MANKNNKYKVYRKYTTDDNGISWVETDEYRIVLVEENSKDCITETPTNTRWVETTGYICANKNKYAKEIKQISTDGGKTWTDTGEYRQGKLIEENSKDCGYTEVQYRWVVINDNSRYVCVGTEKHKMEIRQLSNDGGITWVNVSPEETRASDEIIERNSLDCGGTAIYYKWVDTGFECGSNIPTGSKIVTEAPGELTKETIYRWVVAQGDKDYICDGKVKYYLYVRQQSTDGGLTWSDVQPRKTQKGAVMDNNSIDCHCITKFAYNDGATSEIYVTNKILKWDIDDEAISADIGDCVTNINSGTFSGNTSIMTVTIPNSVTSIGESAFSGSTITSVTIPDSVTSIGAGAFEDCVNLKYATIGSGVFSISKFAFLGCSELTSVSIRSGARIIGYSAFKNCSSLTSVTIPDSVESIDNEAFHLCTSLTSITIPNSVKIIYGGAFENCSSLTSVTIPGSVSSIGAGAFSYCSSLTSVAIESGVTDIGVKAFYNCKSLTSASIGSGVTSIGYGAFDGCASLTSITIPNSVTSIGEYAFSHCTKLLSITIPDSITSIEDFTFNYCTSLTSVTMPNSITSIGSRVFYRCVKLESIFFEGTKEEFNSITKVNDWFSSLNFVVHCTDGDIDVW